MTSPPYVADVTDVSPAPVSGASRSGAAVESIIIANLITNVNRANAELRALEANYATSSTYTMGSSASDAHIVTEKAMRDAIQSNGPFIDASAQKYQTTAGFALGGTHDHLVVQAALADAYSTGIQDVWFGRRILWDLYGAIPEANKGFHLHGAGSISSSPSGVGTVLQQHFVGDQLPLGTDNGLPIAAGGTIQTVSGNGTTITYTTKQGHGLRVGATFSVAGTNISAYNLTGATVTSIPSATTWTVTNSGTGTYSSGGTMTATNSSWDGTAEGLSISNLCFVVHSSLRTAQLQQGVYGSYAPGCTTLRDWRGGSVVLNNVMFGYQEFPWWGWQSDQNKFTDVTFNHCRVGGYVGPKNGQTVWDHVFAYHCDYRVIVDGTNGFTDRNGIHGQSCASLMAPNVIGNSNWVGQSTIGCNGHVIDAPWHECSPENGTESTPTAAFWDLGIGHSAGTLDHGLLSYPIIPTGDSMALSWGTSSPMNNQLVGDVTFRNPIFSTRSKASAGGRTVADGVTNSSATVTSATAVFVAGDVGKHVSGTDIPANTYVGVRNSATSIGLSSSPTSNVPVSATGTHSSNSLTIDSLPYTNEGIRVGRVYSVEIHNPTFIAGPMACLWEFAATLCDAPTGGNAAANANMSLRDVHWTQYTSPAMAAIYVNNASGWAPIFGTSFGAASTSSVVARPAATLFAPGTVIFDVLANLGAGGATGCQIWSDGTAWFTMAGAAAP